MAARRQSAKLHVERNDVDFMKLGGQGKSRSDKPAANANFDGTLTHACPAVRPWYKSILILLIMSYPITIVIPMVISMCRVTAIISAERTLRFN